MDIQIPRWLRRVFTGIKVVVVLGLFGITAHEYANRWPAYVEQVGRLACPAGTLPLAEETTKLIKPKRAMAGETRRVKVLVLRCIGATGLRHPSTAASFALPVAVWALLSGTAVVGVICLLARVGAALPPVTRSGRGPSR